MKEIIQRAFLSDATIKIEACDSAGPICESIKSMLPSSHVYGFTGRAFSLWGLVDEFFPWFGSDWTEVSNKCKK
jgi:hypothetical protein